jgi:flagellar protein FlaF
MQPGSHQAYSRAQTMGDNPQETFARSLLEVARRMTDLQTPTSIPEEEAFDHVLVLNLRIWSAIASEMLDPRQTAPDDVKGNLLSLHRFIDNHTLDVLAERTREKLEILIQINRNLVAGMMPK